MSGDNTHEKAQRRERQMDADTTIKLIEFTGPQRPLLLLAVCCLSASSTNIYMSPHASLTLCPHLPSRNMFAHENPLFCSPFFVNNLIKENKCENVAAASESRLRRRLNEIFHWLIGRREGNEE